MEPFTVVSGVAAPLDRADVDTDQIIPKQFLKRVERTGYGAFLFHDWRYREDGRPDPDFVLNRRPFDEARILITGRNFGCGSSREHAPWALEDFGIRALLGPSFADIFTNNCYQNGMLPVTLDPEIVEGLVARAREAPEREVTVDLLKQEVRDARGVVATFEIDPFRRDCLLKGLDPIDVTLRELDAIEAYEARAGKSRPPEGSRRGGPPGQVDA